METELEFLLEYYKTEEDPMEGVWSSYDEYSSAIYNDF